MKHISEKKVTAIMPSKTKNELPPEQFHPLSYYLKGGIDLSGRELDNTASVEYDTEEQLSELESEGFSAVPFGDPRESKFTLVAKYGSYEAGRIASESGSPTQTAVGASTE